MNDSLDYLRSQSGDRPEAALRPSACPECGSRALGTLAKVITADTFWRCAACGTVFNRKRRQP
ncbi:MAG TPA: hypothetical protein VL693_14695 [Vicinamibacterales bacterium]|jgi:DNA-directed RNA polymerase subunit RPC12/RpoP|nr:hypothetical protein [Vicinamibacterales bacterium]